MRAAENREVEAQLGRKIALLRRLQDAAPELAQVLTQTFGDSIWDERPQNFERAWNWSRAYGWVVRLSAPGSEEQLGMELENTRVRIAHALEQIAAEKAWTQCFNRMTEKERQSLVAWSKAVRSIGRGTGKYAPIHRANARKHMNESRSAIPAWVMPLHRVAETIRPGSELFDIAIIDEASQSGNEALLLSDLAKKLFDSWLELDVFLAIARRGYRVILQVEVGEYRIDLVVHGLEGSLAVECDGDARHGHVLTPGRYVDAAPQEDNGEPFQEKMDRLIAQWREQHEEAARRDAAIEENLARLGFLPDN